MDGRPTALAQRTDIAALLRRAQDDAAAVARLCGGEDSAAAAAAAAYGRRPVARGGAVPMGSGEEGPAAVLSAEAAAAAAAFRPLTVQAPMVRCSRPAFRHTCRLWGTDVGYTHMMIAESIGQSAEARRAEHQVYAGESRLVAQLAAADGPTAARAAELLSGSVDAVELNCGCPQPWVVREGFGAALMERPEAVADMIGHVRRAAGGVPCVVKLRVHGDDHRRTVEWAQRQERAGAAWITVHGRSPADTPSAAVRWEAVRLVRESVAVPVVLNGGVEDQASARQLALRCGVGAVMAGRGLLSNPALFDDDGDASGGAPGGGPVPLEAVSDFVRLSLHYGGPLRAAQLHLGHMLRDRLSPGERRHLTQLRSLPAVASALRRGGLYVPTGRWVPAE